ncbi:MAG: flagellar biosynthesis anti-sigma factor FlgM [Candidatus Sumerlaeia bacterium]
MKISGRKSIRPTSPLSGPAKTGPAEKVDRSDRGDRVEERAADVELSSSLQQVDKAADAVRAMPDVRIEKIEEVKPLVEDGSYKVESKVLAKDMVDASLRESAMQKGKSSR